MTNRKSTYYRSLVGWVTCLCTGKPPWHITNYQGQLSLLFLRGSYISCTSLLGCS